MSGRRMGDPEGRAVETLHRADNEGPYGAVVLVRSR